MSLAAFGQTSARPQLASRFAGNWVDCSAGLQYSVIHISRKGFSAATGNPPTQLPGRPAIPAARESVSERTAPPFGGESERVVLVMGYKHLHDSDLSVSLTCV